MERGELDKSDLKQMKWITLHTQVLDTPIKGWSEKYVLAALDSLAKDVTVSSLCSRYDLTLKDVVAHFMPVLESILPYLMWHALWLLGEPGVGKTPLARIIAMLFSRYHGGPGCFRTASDFDSFRGVRFTKHIPALYDDGEIGNEPIKKKKKHSPTWATMRPS